DDLDDRPGGAQDPGPHRREGASRRRAARQGGGRRVLRPHLQDGRRPAARGRQGVRARRRQAGRRSQELSLPEGYRAGLQGRADGLGLQSAQPEREAHLRLRLFVRRLIGRCFTGTMQAAEAIPRECWKCHAESGAALVCPRCAAIQPLPADADLFAVLGLPRQLALDLPDLERRYHAASRAVHPDRFQTAGPRERALSLAASAAVNRAYRTLRDPVARGRYWLELHGARLGDGGPLVPPAVAFLPGGEVIVGARAKALAGERPLDTILSVKRFMGLGFEHVSAADRRRYRFTEPRQGAFGPVRFVVEGREVTPPEVS